MAHSFPSALVDSLNIIWTIAAKDIVDALKNRVVISMILMLSIILLVPKLLPLIFEQGRTALPIHDLGESQWVAAIQNNPGIALQKLDTEQEWQQALCSGLFPEIGLILPVDFDQVVRSGNQVVLQGYACWGRRNQVADLQPKLADLLAQSLARPVTLQLAGNIVYPPSEGVLYLDLTTLNSVLMLLMMGIFLVPSLLFEEKETRTLQALLVSPASIGQVVVGKALAGSFYILVTAAMIFAISWAEVTHWEIALQFVIGGVIFSVAVGLVLGSFYEKQQDVVGWMTLLVLFLIGAPLAILLRLELPAPIESFLHWVPSVSLAEICRASFSEPVSAGQSWSNLGVVLAVSLPLYLLVIWKVRRSDR